VITAATVTDDESARRADRFPIGATITMDDLGEAHHEHVLDALRESEPLSWLPQLGMWLATGFAVAREVLGADGTTVDADANLVRESLGRMMLTSDGGDHKRLRTPFDPAFRQSHVLRRFVEIINEEVERCIAPVRPLRSCDLAPAFATPYAVAMAGRMLGIELDQAARINEFYEAFAGAMVYDGNPGPQLRANRARAELDEILRRQVARLRRVSSDSITSIVVNAGDETISEDEVVAQLRVIMFGAIETVQSAIVNTLYLLFEHPDELELVREDPDLLPNACEEAMRLLPPVSFIERWVVDEFVTGDVVLGQGEFIGVSVLAANRDASQFNDPLRFDVRRANANRGLSFSFGAHHCIGIRLARLEIAAAVRAWLELPGLRVAEAAPPEGFVFRRSPALALSWS
jgi:cytochrome P450